MTSAALSAKMRRLWADPEWRERQRQRITDGANAQRREHSAKGARVGRRLSLNVRLDEEAFGQVAKLAARKRQPMSELIRTFVQWGLENEGLS